MNPAVSVVIPTRGRPALLAEAVASALTQTISEFEIIVVEDGSSDARAVVEARDPRLNYIWQSQQGVSAARNTGVAASSGEWIAFLDDDDCWHPKKLERQLQFAARHPYLNLVHTDYMMMTASGEYRAREPVSHLPKSGAMLDALVLSPPSFVLTSSLLVRRTALVACGGFNSAMEPCEDYDLLLRLATKHSFGFVDEPLTFYRRHGANATTNRLRANAVRVAVLEHFLGIPGCPVTLRRVHRVHLGRSHLVCARIAAVLGAAEQVRLHTARAIRWNPLDPKALIYGLAGIVGGLGLRALTALLPKW